MSCFMMLLSCGTTKMSHVVENIWLTIADSEINLKRITYTLNYSYLTR